MLYKKKGRGSLIYELNVQCQTKKKTIELLSEIALVSKKKKRAGYSQFCY